MGARRTLRAAAIMGELGAAGELPTTAQHLLRDDGQLVHRWCAHGSSQATDGDAQLAHQDAAALLVGAEHLDGDFASAEDAADDLPAARQSMRQPHPAGE
jgi:hypothetical protein